MIKAYFNGFATTSSSNALVVGNLPFASRAGQGNFAAGSATASEHSFGSGMVAFINNSNTTMYFKNVGTGDANNTALKFSNFYSTGANVFFEAQYQI